jgi:hypothetical protein
VALGIPLEDVNMEAARLPIDEIVTFLLKHVGRTTTAYIAGVSDPKMVSHWAARTHAPRGRPQMRLREAYQAARLLVGAYGDETARAWFLSSNVRLADQAPAYVLRNAKAWDDLRLVVPSAFVFAAAAA